MYCFKCGQIADVETEDHLCQDCRDSKETKPKEQCLIQYICPECKNEWHEVYSGVCDSECDECGTEDIQPNDYHVLKSDSITFLKNDESVTLQELDYYNQKG